jgi:aminopeptidase N
MNFSRPGWLCPCLAFCRHLSIIAYVNGRTFLLVMVGAVVAHTSCSAMEAEGGAIECSKSVNFLAPGDAAPARQYAPDRSVQIMHLALDVTPDFKQRKVQATATLRLKPIAKEIREISLDAVDLDVHSVSATEKIQAYQVTEEKLVVTFAEAIPPEKEVTVIIVYAAEPSEGLYFRTPEMGYMVGDTHLFSQGEEIEARHWYPCLDAPNQRLTSEITCRVPEGMTVVSNGRLVSEDKDPGTGLVVFHWSQEKPHANYLISLVAGYFKKVEDSSNGVPLAFYTPASEIKQAPNSFRHTKDMLAFFEKETGVAYPWNKYFQVCVNDFVAGGMENTSATTLTDQTLFTDATENIRDSDGLIAHELAHQWFGDFVTCKDWSHIWLNEGFATYYETLYGEHKDGHDAMLYELYGRARMITGMTNDFTPIVRRDFSQPREMFGYLVYPKASWVLHMLRSQLGPDLYRQCIKTYLLRHQLGNVVTDDLRAVVEEVSGRSYDPFFDQWLYHGHFPELDITYSWDETLKQAKVSIRQTQDTNAGVLLFHLPLPIRFKTTQGIADRLIQVSQKQEDFYFSLDSAPESVRIDPEYTVLAKISFPISKAMLYAQLADKKDMVGRLEAIEQLSSKTDKENIIKLQDALNQDVFYGVRFESARALRSIHTEESLAALLASTRQSDARVRREVIEAIGGFYADSAYDAARQAVVEEKNPDIQAVALRELAGYSKPDVQVLLLGYLKSDSYRNELADAAIAGLRLADDPVTAAPLLDILSHREQAFTSRGFGQALGTVAYLARDEKNKDAVREFLIGQVNDKRKTVQLADIRALDVLGDPRALAVLEKFATASKTSPERAAAERATADLQAARKPVDDFKNLRQEVLDLEKANRELRKRLDELQKKVEAAGFPRSAGTSNSRSDRSKLTRPKSGAGAHTQP